MSEPKPSPHSSITQSSPAIHATMIQAASSSAAVTSSSSASSTSSALSHSKHIAVQVGRFEISSDTTQNIAHELLGHDHAHIATTPILDVYSEGVESHHHVNDKVNVNDQQDTAASHTNTNDAAAPMKHHFYPPTYHTLHYGESCTLVMTISQLPEHNVSIKLSAVGMIFQPSTLRWDATSTSHELEFNVTLININTAITSSTSSNTSSVSSPASQPISIPINYTVTGVDASLYETPPKDSVIALPIGYKDVLDTTLIRDSATSSRSNANPHNDHTTHHTSDTTTNTTIPTVRKKSSGVDRPVINQNSGTLKLRSSNGIAVNVNPLRNQTDGNTHTQDGMNSTLSPIQVRKSGRFLITEDGELQSELPVTSYNSSNSKAPHTAHPSTQQTYNNTPHTGNKVLNTPPTHRPLVKTQNTHLQSHTQTQAHPPHNTIQPPTTNPLSSPPNDLYPQANIQQFPATTTMPSKSYIPKPKLSQFPAISSSDISAFSNSPPLTHSPSPLPSPLDLLTLLYQQVSILINENTSLHQHIDRLKHENTLLKSHISRPNNSNASASSSSATQLPSDRNSSPSITQVDHETQTYNTRFSTDLLTGTSLTNPLLSHDSNLSFITPYAESIAESKEERTVSDSGLQIRKKPPVMMQCHLNTSPLLYSKGNSYSAPNIAVSASTLAGNMNVNAVPSFDLLTSNHHYIQQTIPPTNDHNPLSAADKLLSTVPVSSSSATIASSSHSTTTSRRGSTNGLYTSSNNRRTGGGVIARAGVGSSSKTTTPYTTLSHAILQQQQQSSSSRDTPLKAAISQQLEFLAQSRTGSRDDVPNSGSHDNPLNPSQHSSNKTHLLNSMRDSHTTPMKHEGHHMGVNPSEAMIASSTSSSKLSSMIPLKDQILAVKIPSHTLNTLKLGDHDTNHPAAHTYAPVNAYSSHDEIYTSTEVDQLLQMNHHQNSSGHKRSSLRFATLQTPRRRSVTGAGNNNTVFEVLLKCEGHQNTGVNDRSNGLIYNSADTNNGLL